MYTMLKEICQSIQDTPVEKFSVPHTDFEGSIHDTFHSLNSIIYLEETYVKQNVLADNCVTPSGDHWSP